MDNSENFPDPLIDSVDVIALPNPGYAGAVNRFMDLVDADRYVILTHEVVLETDAIEALLGALEDARVGAVGPLLFAKTGELFSRGMSWVGSRIPEHIRSEGPPAPSSRSVAAIDGAVWATRRDVVESVGPMDERYFLYFEETDWFTRASERGYMVVCDERATALVGSTPSADMTYYLTRNGARFLRRHRSLRQAVGFLVAHGVKGAIGDVGAVLSGNRYRLHHLAARAQACCDFAAGHCGKRRSRWRAGRSPFGVRS